MNIHSLLSIVVLGVCSLSTIACYDNNDIPTWIWIMAMVIEVIIIIGWVYENFKEKDRKEKSKSKAELRRQRKAEKAKRYNKWIEKYIAENGQPDKSIIIIENDPNEVIHVHEIKKNIYLQGKVYTFKDIISCTYIDVPTTIKGKITATTQTGSVIRRAILGDIVAGPAGAIIGGTTGIRTTEFNHENDRIMHDYTVIINIDSVINPIVWIKTGSNEKLTTEIVGLINVIIARK